jgi:hypothetical protein
MFHNRPEPREPEDEHVGDKLMRYLLGQLSRLKGADFDDAWKQAAYDLFKVIVEYVEDLRTYEIEKLMRGASKSAGPGIATTFMTKDEFEKFVDNLRKKMGKDEEPGGYM